MKTERSSPRQYQVASEIRERIMMGDLKPGEQLPHRTILSEKLDVSGVTIQRALDQLTEEGHVFAIPGTGTFVTKYPPHANRYGIVLPIRRVPSVWNRNVGWSHFWTALTYTAENLPEDKGLRMTVYHNISGHVDVPDFERMQADVTACRLAGLFLLTYRHNMRPISAPATQIPMLSLMGESPAIQLDMNSFFKGALGMLRARGRKRVAVLLPHLFHLKNGSVEATFAREGFELPPWRKQYQWAWGEMECIRNAVQLLLRGSAGERPDALIIADDNLVPYATMGVVASGLSVPKQLDVVAYTNFPLPTTCHVPVLRYGFDVRIILQAAVRMATAMRTGTSNPPDTLVPAVGMDDCQSPAILTEYPDTGTPQLPPEAFA